MFDRKPKEKSVLENAILDLHNQMDSVEADSQEYSKMADQLIKLYRLRDHDGRKRVTPDTLVIAGTNLLGIAMIIHHERAAVIATKALGFVRKLP